MIVRRAARRRNFTVLGNEVLDDARLTESLGLLCYLLSRPDDWHVSLEQLQARFGCGRDKMQGWMRQLRDAGYVRLVTMRDGRGHVTGKSYLVQDEPSVEPSAREPSAAQDVAVEAPSPAIETTTASVNREPEKPVVGTTESRVYRRTVKPAVYKELTFYQIPPTPRSGGVGESLTDDGFARFVEAYRLDPVMSRRKAETAWDVLTGAERAAAIAAAPRYRADCEARQRKRCDAATFLAEKRFEAYAATATPSVSASVFIPADTPQWARWEAWKRRAGLLGPSGRMPVIVERDGRRGTLAPSEWPPDEARAGPIGQGETQGETRQAMTGAA